MKLSNNTLQKLVKGAVRFETENGYLVAHRLTEAQLEHLERTKDFYFDRGHHSAGMRIELKTDASKISFDYKFAYAASHSSLDLYVNGVLHTIMHTQDMGSKGKAVFTLPEGKKLVTVYLPIDQQFLIKNFQIEGKYESVKSSAPRVLWIGDSITQGFGAFLTSYTYQNVVSRLLKYDSVNQGIGGYHYDCEYVPVFDGYKPDKIIVALGTNGYQSSESIEKIAPFYKRLHEVYPDTSVLSITPLWRPDMQKKEPMLALSATIKKESEKYGYLSVDGFTLIENVKEFFHDTVHPNIMGMQLYGRNLADVIKRLKF